MIAKTEHHRRVELLTQRAAKTDIQAAAVIFSNALCVQTDPADRPPRFARRGLLLASQFRCCTALTAHNVQTELRNKANILRAIHYATEVVTRNCPHLRRGVHTVIEDQHIRVGVAAINAEYRVLNTVIA